MRIAVVEDLIHGVETNDVALPNLLAEGFLRNRRMIRVPCTRYVIAEIIVGAILCIAGIIQHESQTTRRAIGQLDKDTLRVVAHVMTHIEGVGGVVQDFDRMGVTRDVRARELSAESESFDRPTTPVKADEIGDWILLRVRRSQARKLKLIEEERTVETEVIRRTHGDSRKEQGYSAIPRGAVLPELRK